MVNSQWKLIFSQKKQQTEAEYWHENQLQDFCNACAGKS